MDSIQKSINAKVKQGLESQKLLCGDCYGFKQAALLEKCGKTCEKMDRIESSPACSSFAPSLVGFDSYINTSGFDRIRSIIAETPTELLRQFGSVFLMELQTRNAGYFFGQKVYVRYRGTNGSNFLSNFMVAYIMYASMTHIRIMSHDGRCSLTFDYRCKANILTPEEFEPLRKKMLKNNKLVDPDTERLLAKRFRAEEEHLLEITNDSLCGNITTIDTVFKENKIKKSKKKITSLIDIAAAVAEGFDISKRYAKERHSRGTDSIIDVSGAE